MLLNFVNSPHISMYSLCISMDMKSIYYKIPGFKADLRCDLWCQPPSSNLFSQHRAGVKPGVTAWGVRAGYVYTFHIILPIAPMPILEPQLWSLLLTRSSNLVRLEKPHDPRGNYVNPIRATSIELQLWPLAPVALTNSMAINVSEYNSTEN